MTKDLAISYDRFSDPKQAQGDSESRQQRAFASFCQRHHLKPAPARYIDRGLSGYRGKHLKGDLGKLLKRAQDGAFPPGTVIVVEAWDRLGRLRPDEQIALISALLKTGLRIGVCRLDDIFAEADMSTHKWTTLSVFVQLAYQESKQKAERVAQSWVARRARAREQGALTTTRIPAWLEVVNGELRPIPDRVATIREIFRLAATGYSQAKIVGKLIKDKVPAFGKVEVKKGNKRSQFSGKWNTSYVTDLLTDRRVLGEHTPTKDGKKEEPIPGYFPQVVDPDEFALVREQLAYRRVPRAPRERTHFNLFQGLLVNATDNGSFILVNNARKDQSPKMVLVNAKSREQQAPFVSFPYAVLERAVLDCLHEIKPSEIAPSARPSNVDVLDARVKALKRDITSIADDLRRQYSPTLTAILREKEEQLSRAKDELDRAQTELAHPLSQAWQDAHDLIGAIEEAPNREEALIRLRGVLRRICKEIVVYITSRGRRRWCFIQLDFEGGAQRFYYLRLNANTGEYHVLSAHLPDTAWVNLRQTGQRQAADYIVDHADDS